MHLSSGSAHQATRLAWLAFFEEIAAFAREHQVESAIRICQCDPNCAIELASDEERA